LISLSCWLLLIILDTEALESDGEDSPLNTAREMVSDQDDSTSFVSLTSQTG
jgi:hypothetical protein